jgi:PAS domain S-box-containing protein
VSPSIERVLGWSPADLIGTPAIDLLAAEDVAAIGEVEATVRGGHLVPSHEVRCRTASGELRWMDVHAQPLRSEAGTIDAAVMGLRDAHAEVLARRALTTLSAGNAILVRAENEDALLAEMCETAVQQGGYLFSWYGRAGADEARTVEPVARARRHADYLDAVTVSWGDGPLGQGPAGTSIRTRRTTILEDASLESYRPWFVEATSRGFRSAISLPVEVDGQIDGAFIVYAAEPHAFDDVAVSLLEDLAAQLGYGLNRLRSERSSTVRWAAGGPPGGPTVEARPHRRPPGPRGAAGRGDREALGFGAHRLEGLACGATIHDLGKNAVPIAILNRPGRLARRRRPVRRHAGSGGDRQPVQWPWPIAEMIHQHHERLDGSGYPQGLAGEGDPARGAHHAVADVFEARVRSPLPPGARLRPGPGDRGRDPTGCSTASHGGVRASSTTGFASKHPDRLGPRSFGAMNLLASIAATPRPELRVRRHG